MESTMITRKRSLILGTGLLAVISLSLTGCLGSGGAPVTPPVEDAEGPLSVQSRLGEGDEVALQTVIDTFNAKGGGQVELNTVTNAVFREQLPSYLTSANPPDIYTYYGGSNLRDLADEGLLLDISDVWEDVPFSDALRVLSQDSDGNEVFVPTSYYWLGVYYKKSVWEAAGAEVPKTWDEFLAANEALEAAGIAPIGIGLSDAPWLASAWFDYINLRVNGPEYHIDLLAGEDSFDSPKVEAVFDRWDEIQPYFDTTAQGLTFAQAVTDMTQGRTGMFLGGSWLQFSLPPEEMDDYDFFQFPIIDPDVPIGEEAPTDGFMASARTDQPKLAKEFLAYLATPEAQKVMYEANGSGTLIPANPDTDTDLAPAVVKGQKFLEDAAGLTQYFNRDSSDALQTTADQALTQYIAGVKDTKTILAEWQTEAEKVRAGQ
jgi:multiple sugar transport system substrate-binding protein